MKVIHIDSGLGNQMLSYCEYLALKKVNPEDDFYLETLIYDIPECNDVVNQWNGYELKRVFGIDTPPNICTLFSEEQWNSIIKEVRATTFWNKNMNWPLYFTQAFNRLGLDLCNLRGNYEDGWSPEDDRTDTLRARLRDTWVWATMRRWHNKARKDALIAQHDKREMLFMRTDKNIYTGQLLAFKYKGNERCRIDDDIRRTFVFPPFNDERNKEMADFLSGCNSVAIHARRGDMLSANGWCYKYGYFRRAVKHIRRQVENPVFVFFTNTGSIDWCKENAEIFGLNFQRDKVLFVDWNKDAESYRDMQLMSYCKHAVITNSTFGWWGAYFIGNPNKITISPLVAMDTTYHC